MISPALSISLAAIYAALYYLVARSALHELKAVDPDYYAYLGAQPGASPKNSTAIIEVLFENGVPKAFYPITIRRKLSIARWLLLLSPIVFLVVAASIFA
jgi:hypothetical protein